LWWRFEVLTLPDCSTGVRRCFNVMRLADWFAERSAKGVLMRAVGAWFLVGLPVIAARIWFSAAAAIAVFVLAVLMYVAATTRYVHRHRAQS
jgi:hypothetical protein